MKYPYAVTCPTCKQPKGRKCSGSKWFHQARVTKAKKKLWGTKGSQQQREWAAKNSGVTTRKMTADELARMS